MTRKQCRRNNFRMEHLQKGIISGVQLGEKSLYNERRSARRAAKELGYDEECLMAIDVAKSIAEISRALYNARQRCFA